MSAATDITLALDGVMAEVVSAGERVAGGKPADIADLSERVTPICAAIAQLPRDEALAFAPTVRTLMTALDRITDLLRDRRDALRERLEQLEAMQP